MADQIDVIKRRYPGAVTFKFGDNAELCAELLTLVRSGKKVATCGAKRQYENGEPMPEPGRRDIALDWSGKPALVIETLEVVECAFSAVTEEMALAEGEDETLEGWRAGHRQYFERNGGFFQEMAVISERFILVEDLTESE
jgi:uncharacterized protein YhfF